MDYLHSRKDNDMKILLTATVQSHICQFHLPLINMLKEQGHEIHVAAKYNLDVKPGLSLENVDKIFDVPFSRSPFSTDNIKAYKRLKEIINENEYDIIHCNTPMGSVVTRLATTSKTTKVIYTAHGFHFYKGAPIKNWLLYFPVEWLLAFKTDMLICINQEDYSFASKHLHAKEVKYVHGVGFDKKRFDDSLTKEMARKELGIKDDETVLLSVGDINKRKNHHILIRALSLLKHSNPHLYIAGWDQLDGELERLAEELDVSSKVTFLGYTRQLSLYFNAADIFLFPSLQEGLPIALIEAMSWGLPVVATNIRGTNDLISNGNGGYLLKTNDFPGFADKIMCLSHMDELRKSFGERNRTEAQKYEVAPVIEEMNLLYKTLMQGSEKSEDSASCNRYSHS